MIFYLHMKVYVTVRVFDMKLTICW